MSNTISSKKATDNMLVSLGITEQRAKEILECFHSVGKKSSEIRYSQIAEEVSKRLDLSINEIFFVGYIIGEKTQMDLISKTFEEIFQHFNESNIQEEIPGGMPIVNKMGYA